MRSRATSLRITGDSLQGYLPSLDLQFAVDKTLTARKGPTPTFTRASGATQVNASGLIEYAPENLILSSNNIASPAWSKEGGTAASSIETVNGLTATVFNENSANSTHRFFRLNDGLAGITSTFSVCLKAAGRRYVCVNLGANGPSINSKPVIDLVDRVVVAGVAGVTINIQLEANGWARYSFTFVPRLDSGTMPIQSNFSSTVLAETGIGLNGAAFYVAGQQYERFPSARAYLPTTTDAAYSPRFDHDPVTLVCKGLLIEESKTNVCLRSEEFDNVTWVKSNGVVTAPVVTANQANSPSGVLNADRIVFPAVSGAGAFSLAVQFFSQFAGIVHTASIYLRGLIGGEKVWWSWTPNGSTYARKECILTTAWQRFDFTYTSTAGNNFIQLGVDLRDASQSAQLAQTIFAWGAQLELGSIPTSYIPTATAALTRSADVCSITGANFTSFWNQSQGTLFASGITQGYLAMASSGSNANQIAIFRNLSPLYMRYDVAVGGAYGAQIAGPTITGASFNKIAGSYALNDVRAAFNGTLGTSDSTVTIPSALTTLNIGSQSLGVAPHNGHIDRIQYFKKRLPAAKLQSLTDLVSDVDAKAYIFSLLAAGATVTAQQQQAINVFVSGEKDAGRWSIHKRLYLPIWGNAAANAICLRSLTSGTFVNSPMMGAGFIKGNTFNSYFNINTTLGALGITSGDGSSIIGLKAETSLANRGNYGAINAGGYIVDFRPATGLGRRMTWLQSDTNVSGTFDTAQRTGVIVSTRTSASQYTIHNDTSDLGTVVYAGGVPTVNPFVMARNNGGGADLFGDSEIAFVGFGLGLSAANAKAYAAATKNLWQICTGLILP